MLEMRGITKRFPGVVANEDVDFTVLPGQVHTLLGENGAGKSTLVKILYGLYQPDEGSVSFEGTPVKIDSPSVAIQTGIGMIHQHFMLVDTLTVAENVALGLGSALSLTNLAPIRRRIKEVSEEFGLHVDPDAYIWQMAVGERQRAEIVKALYRNVRLLVLDEPTAVLTPPEVTDLFVTLRQLTANGRGLVFISHKLNEVMEISDEITVLRDGRVSGRTTPSESSRESLATMMVGRPVEFTRTIAEQTPGEPKLEVRNLRVRGDRGELAVNDVSIDARAGEIVGIVGVSGNGQRELAESIIGLRETESGQVCIDGKTVKTPTPKHVRSLGLAYVPEERMKYGSIGDFTVAENLILVDYDQAPYVRNGLLSFSSIEERSEQLVDDYSIRTPGTGTLTRKLSGGNIQKVVIAREFSGRAGVLLVAQPTRGVDIGAAEYIHEQLLKQRSQGKAILLISEDLDEVMALSDRLVVMYEGQVMGRMNREDATIEQVGLLMSGVGEPEGA
ncbi:ABC transporter ATP-binding protein [Candidatus Poriferisocius sp.]|uniref:ABC transporter ATP-binding protein n=1 Tax=Candidatus Poriferisocius sp. TaxID=3101276 RepID=UPI003B52B08A